MGKIKIQAPNELKLKTIKKMEQELSKPNRIVNNKFKTLLTVAATLFMMICSAFAYDYFSCLRGDDLSINSEYKGNGIVHIEVENKSHKNLKFSSGILKSWIDNEDLIYLNEKGMKNIPCIDVDMPLIKGGEKKTIIVDLSDCNYKKLEAPIKYNDGFVFILTNDEFRYGQTWQTAIRFNNKIIENEKLSTKEILIQKKGDLKKIQDEENVSNFVNEAFITEIKENYPINQVLDNILVSFEYDDRMIDPRVSLAGDIGDNIYAISDGIIKEQGYDNAKGNYVIIEHSKDFFTEYRHCSEILVKTEQSIKAGDIIAKLGTTGRSTGPHLSLTAKYKGENIDPILLFSDKNRNKNKSQEFENK